MNYRCFKEGCELETQYFHKYLLSEVYCCESHLKALNRILAFDSLFTEPCQRTKDAVLGFLEKENFKREEIKKNILAHISKNLYSLTEIPEETLRNIDSDLEEIGGWIEKISQARKIDKKEQDSILNMLILQPDIALKKLREMIPASSDQHNSIRRIYWLNKLKTKTLDIWNKFNISEFEQDFSETCELYKNQKFPSDLLLVQTYQEYLRVYYRTNYFPQLIYGEKPDPWFYKYEEEKEYIKFLDYQWKPHWNASTTFIQLPNGEIFIIRETLDIHKAYIIDKKCNFLELPSPYYFNFAYPLIYFNRSVYCMVDINSSLIFLRYDLDQNRWIYLTLIQSKNIWNSIIVNRNILISAKECLLLYSIDINSFSIISYKHKDEEDWLEKQEDGTYVSINCKSTWLAKAAERLYLIEYFGKFTLIYESAEEDVYTWKIIAESNTFFGDTEPQYCLYNKGKIYFSSPLCREQWKFDLSQMAFTEKSFSSDFVSLKQTGKNLEKIECYCETLKFDSDSAAYFIHKGWTLKNLGNTLNKIEKITRELSQKADANSYNEKGYYLNQLGMHLEAIKCLNEAIRLIPQNDSQFIIQIYKLKGDAYRKLGRNIEAIELYDHILKINPNSGDIFLKKGNALLYDLGRNIEAIVCYNKAIDNFQNCQGTELAYFHKGNALLHGWRISEAIKCYDEAIYNHKDNEWCVRRNIENAYNNKGYALNKIGRYLEAVECYNEAIKENPRDAMFYNNKGDALNALGRHWEAIECYNKAIELEPSDFLLLCNRGRVFNDANHELDALNDFNAAYNLMQKSFEKSSTSYLTKEILKEWNSNFLNDKLRKDYIKLLKILVQLQEYVIKFRDEFLSLKNAALNNWKLKNKIEKQNKAIKAQMSRFITKVIEVLGSNYHETYEEVKQNLYKLEEKALKCEKLLTTNIFDFKYLLKIR